ncbi:18722_t:CDS:2, partial [Racocetra persica]
NNFAIRELAKQLTFLSININVELFQNRCLAHIINLIVQDGIKKISNIIKKVRDCVKAIHTSPKCRQAFVDACDYEVIDIIIPSLDCTTRWNSTYNMLNSAIKVKQA